MQQQLTTIASPRFSQALKRIWEPLKTKRHELKAIEGMDILFIPEKQLAFVAVGNNPVKRYSVSSADAALNAHKAQLLITPLLQPAT